MSAPSFDLVLLPGTGGDARMFDPQRTAFPHLQVPDWIPPRRRESLPDYAQRLAGTIRVRRPLILGGVSLGGMMAWELAPHLQPAAVVLIASCRTRRGIRTAFRALRPLLTVVPAAAIQWSKRVAPLVAGRLTLAGARYRPLVVDMFRGNDPRFIRWALEAMLDWRPRPADATPVFHIHGACDYVIPDRCVEADELVPGAGHLLNMTHPQAVNAFLAQVAQRLASVEST